MFNLRFYHFTLILILIVLNSSCKNGDDFSGSDVGGQNGVANGCEGFNYPNWQTSPHKLPFPVGQSYSIGLSNCTGGSSHAPGTPDQFAIDIIMDIGTLVTASRKGTIMYVEESGLDYEPLNNVVVLRDEDGYFLQYHHLTFNGALVEEGDFVDPGDPIGYSGASGNVTFPHLHFVATDWDWVNPYGTHPYESFPITFSNTTENPKSLIQGETYEALSY